MNIQTPASRKTDPESSFLAEKQITNSGKRQTHQRIIKDFLVNHPGHTAAEIGVKTGLGQIAVTRRLSELNGVYAQRGVQRKCRVNGSVMATWMGL